MKISKIEENKLIFNNNSYITYDTYTHYSYYALATNYPDFYVRSELFAYDFELPLQFGKTKGGFYFEKIDKYYIYLTLVSKI